MNHIKYSVSRSYPQNYNGPVLARRDLLSIVDTVSEKMRTLTQTESFFRATASFDDHEICYDTLDEFRKHFPAKNVPQAVCFSIYTKSLNFFLRCSRYGVSISLDSSNYTDPQLSDLITDFITIITPYYNATLSSSDTHSETLCAVQQQPPPFTEGKPSPAISLPKSPPVTPQTTDRLSFWKKIIEFLASVASLFAALKSN